MKILIVLLSILAFRSQRGLGSDILSLVSSLRRDQGFPFPNFSRLSRQQFAPDVYVKNSELGSPAIGILGQIPKVNVIDVLNDLRREDLLSQSDADRKISEGTFFGSKWFFLLFTLKVNFQNRVTNSKT